MDQLNINNLPFRETETFLKHQTDGPKRDKGQLIFQIDLPDNPGAEDSIAEKIWRSLHDSFFNCDSDDQYYCFEEALKVANEELEKENKKRETGSIGRIHGVVSLYDGDNLHFSQIGQGVVYLKRAEYFSQISEAPELESLSSFSTISSGELADGDVVVFSSRPLPFGEDDLLDAFSQKESKIPSELKSLSKQKDFEGLLSFFTIPQEEVAVEEEKEESVVETKMVEIEEEISEKEDGKKKKGKAGKMLQSLSKRLNKEKVNKAKSTAKGVFSGIKSKFSKLIKKPSRIKHVNRRYVLLFVILLIIALGVIVVLMSGYNKRAEEAAYYEDLLSQANNNIAIAENRFLIGEKNDATDFLNKAASAVTEISDAGFYKSDIDKLEKQILVFRDHFDKISRVEEPNLLADLSAKGTVDALGIIHAEDQNDYVYEPRRLFETLLDKVQEPLSIDSEEIVLAGEELEDFNVLSFITQGGQVIEYSSRNGSFEVASTLDDTWNKGIDLKTFNGDFIYLLDPPSNTIWKYRRQRNGYSNAIVYTSEGDLSNAVSIAIDGDIFVLLRDGTILQYRKGSLIEFKVKDQPSVPLKNPTRIFTLPEANYLYVLDSSNKRIVVYSKGSGGISTYEKQVVFDNFKENEIRDFYIDKDEQKVVVLTADKSYITDL